MESEEFVQVSNEYRELSQKFKDPLVIGTLLHRLSEERQSTNLLLREINAKLDRIESLERRLAEVEAKLADSNIARAEERAVRKVLLPEVDEAIVAFVKEKSAVCADEVQEKFQYKGKNAASARLNKLCALGVVKKTQVGKKVYFEIIETIN